MVKLYFSVGRPGILLQECGGTKVIGCQPPSRRRRGSTWGDHQPPSLRDGASKKAAWVPLGSWIPRGISSDLQWQRDEAPLARGGGTSGGWVRWSWWGQPEGYARGSCSGCLLGTLWGGWLRVQSRLILRRGGASRASPQHASGQNWKV